MKEMKLIAARNFWFKDTVRGKMVSVKNGEEFTLSVREDAEQIFSIISSLSGYPIDSEFVPEHSKYVCVHPFSYQLDGEDHHVSPGQIVVLSQKEAVKQMVGGFCRPVNFNQWSPKKLLESEIKSREDVKQMFDVEPPPKESWVMKGRRKE